MNCTTRKEREVILDAIDSRKDLNLDLSVKDDFKEQTLYLSLEAPKIEVEDLHVISDHHFVNVSLVGTTS